MPVNFLPSKMPQVPRPPSSDPQEVEARLWSGFGGALAFDIGANVGQSLWHMVEVFDTIVSLEPAHESFRALKKTWGGRDNVVLLMEAAGDHVGTIETSMREVQIYDGQLVAAGMPYKKFMPGVTSPADSLPWGREVGTRAVPSTTLDALAAKYGIPSFVKIDTEGHEAQVMRGATELLKEQKTSFVIEFHLYEWYTECITILGEAGYGPEIIRHPHYRPGSELWSGHGWIRAEAPRK
jgi:FkbM family methyltransferase